MEYPKYSDRISLIPGGCPQLLDFSVDLTKVERLRRNFEERQDGGIRPLVEKDGEFVDALDGQTAIPTAWISPSI